MKKTIPYIVLVVLCLFFNANAQFYKPSDKTVRIGETLPESFYQTIHQTVNTKTGKAATLQLSKYRNKLIILDFWATWCGPCIRSLIDLDSIQRELNTDDVIIIPVTYQSEKVTANLLGKYKWNFKSIVDDTTLGQLFGTTAIPFQVWIKDGRLIANPQPQYVTAHNIRQTIAGIKADIPSAKKAIDASKELWRNENGKTNPNKLYQSSIAPGDPAYAQQRLVFNCSDRLSLLTCFNVPLLRGMFFRAFEPEISKYATAKEGSGFLLELRPSLKKLLQPEYPEVSDRNIADSISNTYVEQHQYSYNLAINKLITRQQALKIMQQDLNNYFGLLYGIEAVVENRPLKMAVLRLTRDKQSTEKLLNTKGGPALIKSKNTPVYKLRNTSFENVFSAISVVRIAPKTTFIDSTGLDKALKIDFDLPYVFKDDFEGAKKHFKTYGISLNMEEVSQPILIIRERKIQDSPTTI